MVGRSVAGRDSWVGVQQVSRGVTGWSTWIHMRVVTLDTG